MAQGFYELLGMQANAPIEDIRLAYHEKLAELVRRLRAARSQGADVSILEAQERSLKEAMEVLSDPVRRRRYDAYRQITRNGVPNTSEELWDLARGALVDPVAGAAVCTVRTLTDLPLGDALPEELEARDAPPVAESVRQTSTPPSARLPEVRPPVQPITESEPAVAMAQVVVDATDPMIGMDGQKGDTNLRPPSLAELMGDSPAEDLLAGVEVDLAEEPLASDPTDDWTRWVERYGYDGRLLKAVRESKGLDLNQLAQETRISLRYLEAIEQNGFDRLPTATFVRGYVKEVCRILEISDSDALDGYMALFSHHRG